MSDILEYTKGSHNPLDVGRTLAYKWRFLRDNPEYFYPAGIWVFCGPQGSGKTLSAVQTLQRMVKDYPAVRVISNVDVDLPGWPGKVEPFVDYSQLSTETNGIRGIIFFLDEVHVLWNSLESKNIPISEMACFCQMRKDRRVIIGTSQVYSRIAKPIREQLQYVITCRNYFNILQHNTIIDPANALEKDGTITGDVLGNRWWIHRAALYKAYDTLAKITRAERRAIKRG